MSRAPTPSGNFIDLSDAHAKATVDVQGEDKDMQKAMAASMKDTTTQENGTTSSGRYFGSADRPHYPASQWALAPIASSREVVEHPPAFKRRRVPGQPAFLRSSSDTDYNASLLTIYHSIPLAREALLLPSLHIYSYGHDPEWWSGTTNENDKILSSPEYRAGDDDQRRYLAEVQCLMAFLDNTSRAYGSVDALSGMRHYQNSETDDKWTKLFEAWRTAAVRQSPDQPLTQVFTSVGARSSGPLIPGTDIEEKEMFQLEGAVRGAPSLTAVLDKVLWYDVPNEALDDVWLERLSHIFTLRIYNDATAATDLGVDPIEVLYLDRYTSERKDVVLRMRQRRQILLREIDRWSRAQYKVAHLPNVHTGPSPADMKSILETAKGLVPTAMDESLRSANDYTSRLTPADNGPVQQHMDALIAQVDANVKKLGQKKAELDLQIRAIMSDLTDPEQSSAPLKNKYTLQGVSTKPNITYLRRHNPDLIDLDEESDDAHESWQWWRLAWGEENEQQLGELSSQINGIPELLTNSAASPYSVRKVTLEEVLHSTRNENTMATLVYADSTAMDFAQSPLSTSLQSFVEQDNRALEDEITHHRLQHSGRQRAWSNETNSTIMDDGNPFEDGASSPNHASDTTPLSSSTLRSPSELSSPTRARSTSDSMHSINLMDEPPSYESIAGRQPAEMSTKSGNKIGHFAEQLLLNVEQHEQEAKKELK